MTLIITTTGTPIILITSCCNNSSFFIDRNRKSKFIGAGFSINILTYLIPRNIIIFIYTDMTGISTTTIIISCTNNNNVSFTIDCGGPTGLIIVCLTIYILSELIPRNIVPSVYLGNARVVAGCTFVIITIARNKSISGFIHGNRMFIPPPIMFTFSPI